MVLSFSDSWELQSVHYVIRIKLCRDSDPSLVTIFRIRIHNSDEITWELRSILYVIRIKLCQDSDPSLIRIFRIRIHNTINPMTPYRLRILNTNQIAWAQQGVSIGSNSSFNNFSDPDPQHWWNNLGAMLHPLCDPDPDLPRFGSISGNNFSDRDPQHYV